MRPPASSQADCVVELPDTLYDFARAPDARPAYQVEVDFGPLRLLGYDIVEQAYYRRVGVRLYWVRTGSSQEEPAGMQPVVTWLGENGQVVGTSEERPFVELSWYSAERWGVGEVVKTETMVWDMGEAFRIQLAVEDAHGNSLPAQLAQPDSSAAYIMESGSWLRLPAFRWEGAESNREVVAVDEGALSSESPGALFGGSISMEGFETGPGG